MNTATATVSDICNMFETTSTRRSIQAAIDAGWMICKCSCPAEHARDGLTIDEATEIIASDPSVVYFTRT